VSLKLPLNPFAKGVRMARVITTSSAFLDVLGGLACAQGAALEWAFTLNAGLRNLE